LALSLQSNYTEWATATGRPILVPTSADRGVSCCQHGGKPTAVSFLDQSRYLFFQVAPHLSSQGWVDPVPDLLLLRKYCSPGNWTRDLCKLSKELWSLDHRGGLKEQLMENIIEEANIGREKETRQGRGKELKETWKGDDYVESLGNLKLQLVRNYSNTWGLYSCDVSLYWNQC
jgi:hypothetical protein